RGMGMMTLSRGCLALVSVLLLSACSDGDSVINEPVIDNGGDSTSSNVAPAITSVPLTTATEDVLYEHQLAAKDPDDPNNGSALVWRLLTAPTGMTISPTGLIRWTPPEGVSSATVRVQVRDGGENGAQPA